MGTVVRAVVTLFMVSLLSGSVLVAAGAAPGALLADAASSPFVVSRDGDTYHAVSQTTASSYSGSLKFVVESAVDELDLGGGGVVSFLAGDFDLDDEWMVFVDVEDITFEGQGIDTTVVRNDVSVASDSEPFSFTRSDRITIRDITVDAGGPDRSTSDALDFDGGDDIVVESVKIADARGRGIIFDGKDAGQTADGNVVRDCVVLAVPEDGIQLLAASNNTIEDCTIIGAGSMGIRINKASASAAQPHKQSNDNIISGNHVEGSDHHGIGIKSGDHNLITGNTVLNAQIAHGIVVQSSAGIGCDDNIIELNTATDNQPTKTQKFGLAITHSECNRTVVTGNDFTGNRDGEISDGGTDTIYPPSNFTFNPVADTFVDAGSPNTNYGDRNNLRVDGSPERLGFVRFDVAGVVGSVTSATLRVYAKSNHNQGFDVSSADNGWDEQLVTYADAPSYGPSLGGSGPFTAGTWTEIDVTGVVAGDGQYSFALTPLNNTNMRLAARQTAHPAELMLTVGDPSDRTFNPVADTYVDASDPTKNFGDRNNVRVDGSPERRSYVRFNVTGLTGTVTGATLRLYAKSNHNVGFEVQAADNSWDEHGMTFSDAAGFGPPLALSGQLTANTWIEIDLTGYLTGDGLVSFALTSLNNTNLRLAARQTAHAPELVVTQD